MPVEHIGEAGTVQRGGADQAIVVEDQAAGDDHLDRFAVLLQFPAVKVAAAEPSSDAYMVVKVRRHASNLP